MYIDDIVKIMPPAKNPLDVPGRGEWVAIESKLGTGLPDDYKEFIQAYGTGRIGNFLYVFTPFSNNENLNLLDQLRLQSDVLGELKSYGENIPYKIFPETEGILPFAITDNGDVLFWRTVGEPNEWTVLVNEARSPDWENYDMSMSKFFSEIISHRLDCKIFPKSFPGASPSFEVSN